MNELVNDSDILIDGYTLTNKEIEEYDFEATYNNVINKIIELKRARNRYINGYHLRVTTDYTPKLSNYTFTQSDKVGSAVENKLDSEYEYNQFNIKLQKLFEVMSKPEIAYISDCLLNGEKEVVVKDKFVLPRRQFERIKKSSVIRFALAFYLEEYSKFD